MVGLKKATLNEECSFTASVMSVDDSDVMSLVFVDVINPRKYFSMQALGENEIYAERNSQAQGCYGGIEEATYSENKLKIKFNELGRATIKCQSIELTFERSISMGEKELKRLLFKILNSKLKF